MEKIENAISKVERSDFIPEEMRSFSTADISFPSMDGTRIPSLQEIKMILKNITLKENSRVLIIGNNAGYSAAVFSKIFTDVYLIETSRNQESYGLVFTEENYPNVEIYFGSSYDYFNKTAPFDIIFIQGGIKNLTNLFTDQLKNNGELVAPLMDPDGIQQLIKYKRTDSPKDDVKVTISIIGTTFFRVLY